MKCKKSFGLCSFGQHLFFYLNPLQDSKDLCQAAGGEVDSFQNGCTFQQIEQKTKNLESQVPYF